MDMWTTQERCPHAHSLNNKYKSQTISQGLNRPQILRRRHFVFGSHFSGGGNSRCAFALPFEKSGWSVSNGGRGPLFPAAGRGVQPS
jgi:hypothetical protein